MVNYCCHLSYYLFVFFFFLNFNSFCLSSQLLDCNTGFRSFYFCAYRHGREITQETLLNCVPRMNLLNSYPYSRGRACSRCPRGTQCRDKLCYRPGEASTTTIIIIVQKLRALSFFSYGLLHATSAVKCISPYFSPMSISKSECHIILHNY